MAQHDRYDDEQVYTDCRLCVHVIKDRNGNIIGCRHRDNCIYENKED